MPTLYYSHTQKLDAIKRSNCSDIFFELSDETQRDIIKLCEKVVSDAPKMSMGSAYELVIKTIVFLEKKNANVPQSTNN